MHRFHSYILVLATIAGLAPLPAIDTVMGQPKWVGEGKTGERKTGERKTGKGKSGGPS